MLDRLSRLHALVYEVDLGDRIPRLVRIGERLPIYNKIRPDMNMLAFRLEPLVLTPYLSEIGGVFYATRLGVQKGVVSWVPDGSMAHLSDAASLGRSQKVYFSATTDQAQLWLERRFARLVGARYRSHKMLHVDQYEYTREP